MDIFGLFDSAVGIDDSRNKSGNKNDGNLGHDADSEKSNHDRNPAHRRDRFDQVKQGSEKLVKFIKPGHADSQGNPNDDSKTKSDQCLFEAHQNMNTKNIPVRIFMR